MKTINLKWIALTLSVLMLLQSCKVYHSKTATIDEVIESQKRVKVKSYNGEIYKFDKLHRENDQIFGIAKIKSQEWLRNYAKQFGQGEVSGKEVKFSIPDNAFKEYYLQNKTLSTILTVAIPVVVVIGIVGLAYLLYLSSDPYQFPFIPFPLPY